MDAERRYHKHMANAATSGLTAALALKRLKNLSPRVAQQLFEPTVALAMDYTSSLWMHVGKGLVKTMERALRGSFQTVSLAIAEAEACIQQIHQRHQVKAIKL